MTGKSEGKPHGWLYEWTCSSATWRPDEDFTGFTTDEAYARNGVGHRNITAVYTHPSPPEGMVMVPRQAGNAITCAIEAEIDSQLVASGMTPGLMHRQDGSTVWDAAIAAVSPPLSEEGASHG